jgi:hypothetical protein
MPDAASIGTDESSVGATRLPRVRSRQLSSIDHRRLRFGFVSLHGRLKGARSWAGLLGGLDGGVS